MTFVRRVKIISRLLDDKFPGYQQYVFGASSGSDGWTVERWMSKWMDESHGTLEIGFSDVKYLLNPTPEELEGMLRRTKYNSVRGLYDPGKE